MFQAKQAIQAIPKVVVLLSGGLDSSVLCYYLKNLDFDVYPVAFNYNQRHKRELASAWEISKDFNLLKIISIPELGYLGHSSQTDSNIPVPQGHYADDSMKLTVVPNRNMIFLAFAAAYAITLESNIIATAIHSGDHPIYPDCRPEFSRTLDECLHVTWNIRLRTPFVNQSKADIVAIGDRLKVPFQTTWSCYEGREAHCGKCGTCVERKEAFLLNHIIDPTAYEV